MSTAHRCGGSIHRGSGFRSACDKSGKVQRGDQWYCGTHDPVKRAERMAATTAKWHAKWEAETAARDASRTRLEALERDALLWRAHADALREALQELRNIAEAERFDHERFDDDTTFADWAQSRARHTLAKLKGVSA